MAKIYQGTYDQSGSLVKNQMVAQVEVTENFGVVLVLHGQQVLTSSYGGGWGLSLELDTATELAEDILRTVAQAEAAAESFALAEYNRIALAEYNRIMESLDGFDY